MQLGNFIICYICVHVIASVDCLLCVITTNLAAERDFECIEGCRGFMINAQSSLSCNMYSCKLLTVGLGVGDF